MWYDVLMAHKLEKGRCMLRLGARGRLVLPAEVCRTLALKEGDRILLSVGKDGRLALTTLGASIRALQRRFRHLKAGGSMAEELLRDRREEAAREAAGG